WLDAEPHSYARSARELARPRRSERCPCQRVLRRRLREQGRRGRVDGHPRRAVEEDGHAGDDADHARGGAVHRARADGHGRPRAGFSQDGRITALDLFIVEDNGPYGPMGDYRSAASAASLIWQPLAMRWRGVAVLTNTPPRSQQRSPGAMQANAIMEPVVTKA